ncbi:MAG: ATP-binding protein [Desulfobacterales bacterium]|nr:ATP-binding protein [Desulfobacterales bacterium]
MDYLTWNLVYGCLSIFSGMASIGLAVYLIHDRQNKGARQMLFLLVCSGIWSVGYGLELLCPDLAVKLWWVRVEYIGAATVGLMLFRFVLMVTGPSGMLAGKWVNWLWVVPALVILAGFTNQWHHLLWRDVWLSVVPGAQTLQFHRGPVFWLHVVFSYSLILISFVLLLKSLVLSVGTLRMQVMVMLPGIILPWVANGLYLMELPGLSNVDLSPLAFMVTSMVFAVGLFRYHLVNLIPLAHEAVMDGLGDPVIVLDMDDHVVEVNQACLDVSDSDQMRPGRTHVKEMFPDLYKVVSRSRGVRAMEFQTVLEIPGTGQREWHLRISPLWGKRGRQSGWLVVLRDVTDQNEAEKELRHARNYVRSIINSMPSVIIGVDREGKVTQWNEGAVRLTGISEDKGRGGRLTDLFPQIVPCLPDLERAMETRQVQRLEKQALAIETGGAEPQTILADIVIFPVSSRNMPGAVIRVDDISEQVKIQEMMVQSEKMMSVGGLAAGMAHEINNPLSGMIQNIQVIRNRLSKPLPANIRAAEKHDVNLGSLQNYMEDRNIFYMMDQAVSVGDRAAKIVDNMLSFSRKHDSSRSSHSIPDMVDATLMLLENDYNLRRHYDFRAVEIEKTGLETLPPVPCEKSKIQQVLFNILKNGTQAMALSKTEQPGFRIRYFTENEMAGVEITDNGPGIPEAVRKRIFEPFFTTKPVGTGTGLGLSVSYFIVVENHKGELTVDTLPGNGAAFTIKLPMRGKE